MNKNNKIYIGIALAATAGLLVLLTFKKKKQTKQRRLSRVSDEGYETAHDVLFPLKIKRLKRDRAM